MLLSSPELVPASHISQRFGFSRFVRGYGLQVGGVACEGDYAGGRFGCGLVSTTVGIPIPPARPGKREAIRIIS